VTAITVAFLGPVIVAVFVYLLYRLLY
jgi:hypothetical protein